MAENLYRKATGDGREAVIAAIFWLKTRAQWKETTVQEFAGPPPALKVTWHPAEPLDDPASMINVTPPNGRR